MDIALFSFTDRGSLLKERLSAYLARSGHQIITPTEYLEGASGGGLKEAVAAAFKDADALIFIGAAGIAVRAVAPLVHSKLSDPAVIVIDEQGKWIIPLLGGHIGGGNELARIVALFLEAEAVITTATDTRNLFAVDEWAYKRNLVIDSMEKAKKVSAALLRGEELWLQSDYPILGTPPQGILYQPGGGEKAGFGIVVSMKRAADGLPLRLIPRRVYIGIGCRKGAGEAAIAEAFDAILESLGLDRRCAAGIGSIDIKKTEAGLLKFCERRSLSCTFFSATELQSAEGSVSPSGFVKETVGVDNVCERAAILSAGNGKLLMKKTARNGVSAAAALANIELRF
ncbi:MAG: cobalamin biosynthesis protein [Spirochaetaceae bacterium]|jgi:cobalt-precorrin 5A hydrolase|nr:cobalamin biosynthesis protein [Spirochaetaceae bacterium]